MRAPEASEWVWVLQEAEELLQALPWGPQQGLQLVWPWQEQLENENRKIRTSALPGTKSSPISSVASALSQSLLCARN